MKIAYIILAHKNVEQINYLIKSLSDDGIDFYIHIDSKSKINRKEILEKNTYVLPEKDSVDIKWGQNSMVIATLKVLKKIISTKNKYDYVCLLSGQDLPIMPKQQIYEFLNKDDGINFIEVFETNSNLHRRYDKRTSLWYPKWMTENKLYIKVLRRLYILITGGYNRTIFLRRKKYKDIEFRYGSQWWMLTYDCIKYIYEYIEENKEFLSYFDNTLIPDECIFQTIFMSSPYAAKHKSNLTYIDWSENKRSPKTFTMGDLEELIEKKEFVFARKFDMDIDSNIINSILDITEQNGDSYDKNFTNSSRS